MLVNSGRDVLVQSGVGEAATPFNEANAHVGVGDGVAAEAATQTDLQGTSSFRKAVNAGFPTRNGNTLTYEATFGTTDANFDWNEWAVFNAAAVGAMLNRKVEPLGTKTNTQTWKLTVNVTINSA